MAEKSTNWYEDRRLPILVRYFERRLNQSRKSVPGTLLERYTKVHVTLCRRGRNFELQSILSMLEILHDPIGAKTLASRPEMNGLSKNAIKHTIYSLRRLEKELYPDD